MAIDKEAKVLVPRWALRFVLDHGDFQDEGPIPEGWRSREMTEAMEALEATLSNGKS